MPSRIEIRGERGVITEKGVSYANKWGQIVSLDFVFHRDIDKINITSSLSHVSLGDRIVYENEFYPASLNDDEIAIAKMLSLCAKGENPYPIKEGIEDARLGHLL